MAIGKFRKFAIAFKKARKARGYTLKKASEVLGIPKSTLSNYERAISGASIENIRIIKEKLGLTDADFEFEATPESNARFVGLEAEGLKRVPVISWARAGSATDYEDMQNYIDEWTVTQTKDENAFAIIVEGDSMEPVYLAGDLIVCAPHSPPRNGKAVVARLRNALQPNSGGVLLKRFFRTGPNGETIRLESANPNYATMEFRQEDFWFIYPVVTMIRKER